MSGFVGSNYRGGEVLSVSLCGYGTGHGKYGFDAFAGCAVQRSDDGGDRSFAGAGITLQKELFLARQKGAVALSILYCDTLYDASVRPAM